MMWWTEAKKRLQDPVLHCRVRCSQRCAEASSRTLPEPIVMNCASICLLVIRHTTSLLRSAAMATGPSELRGRFDILV